MLFWSLNLVYPALRLVLSTRAVFLAPWSRVCGWRICEKPKKASPYAFFTCPVREKGKFWKVFFSAPDFFEISKNYITLVTLGSRNWIIGVDGCAYAQLRICIGIYLSLNNVPDMRACVCVRMYTFVYVWMRVHLPRMCTRPYERVLQMRIYKQCVWGAIVLR